MGVKATGPTLRVTPPTDWHGPTRPPKKQVRDLTRIRQKAGLKVVLQNIPPLLQQARDQDDVIIVQDLREAAVSTHIVTFERKTDSDLGPAMAAARSAGDNLRIQPYSASLMVGNASGPGQLCCVVVLRTQNAVSVSILSKCQGLTPSIFLFLQLTLLVFFDVLVLVAILPTDSV